MTTGIIGLQQLGAESWISNAFNGAALLLGVGVAQVAGERRRSSKA